MVNQDFSTTLLVEQTPEVVFNAISNVRGWWSEEIEGNTEHLNDVFFYHYQDIHRCQIKLIEVVPNEKIVWFVIDNYFSFTKNTSEWTGTTIVFEISKKGSQTQMRFTHLGLVPSYECYAVCIEGWSNYIQNSLLSLITIGKGQPNSSDNARTAAEKKLSEERKQ